jgi:LacI family repressor for deo operon, udp, cdd, tsx, nupC, and nupG
VALTLKDVAARAGVSTGTVSKVINNARYVKADTRKRVLAAIAELDYRPSLYASTLRNNRSYTVGIMSERPLVYEYVSAALTGLLGQFAEHGLAALVIELGATSEAVRETLNQFRQRHVAGIIHIGSGFATSAVTIAGWTPPRIHLFTPPEGVSDPIVLADEVQGAAMGTQHLIDLGHRRIAFIGGPEHSHSARSRFLGFERALATNGLDRAPELVRHGHWEEAHGFAAVFDLMAMRADFTAVFGGNDFIAAGALHALQTLGKRVPQEVAVLGFDNHTTAGIVRPGLTTVALPSREMGRAAARLLVARIAADPAGDLAESLPCRLVMRQSTITR